MLPGIFDNLLNIFASKTNFKPRVVDRFHFRVFFEELCNAERIGAVLAHAYRKGCRYPHLRAPSSLRNAPPAYGRTACSGWDQRRYDPPQCWDNPEKDQVRPELLRFLDAEKPAEKLTVLREIRGRMDEELITGIELSGGFIAPSISTRVKRYAAFASGYFPVSTGLKNSTTMEPLVVYQALYGNYRWYVRTVAEFLSPVDTGLLAAIFQKILCDLLRHQAGSNHHCQVIKKFLVIPLLIRRMPCTRNSCRCTRSGQRAGGATIQRISMCWNPASVSRTLQ